MKTAKLTVRVDLAWRALYHACERTTETDRLLGKAIAASLRCEKEHRGFMPGFRDHHPKALSMRTAARYFILRSFYETAENPKSWYDAATYREDIFFARALRQAFEHFVMTLPPKPDWLDAVEYSRDIARSGQ